MSFSQHEDDDYTNFLSDECDQRHEFTALEDLQEGQRSYFVQEMVHSLSSFMVMIVPVTIAMLVSSWCAVHVLNDPDQQQIFKSYLVYNTTDDSSPSEKIDHAIINSLAIIGVIAISTITLALCYKFDCHRFLVGYLIFSTSMLYLVLGGQLFGQILNQYRWIYHSCDILTFGFVLVNFSLVGVISIYYQKGIPLVIQQGYLILTSIILAWHFAVFPEWTTWTLLVGLGLWDIIAVLTPCGPLKLLVKLVEQKQKPLPGLLYEAQIPLLRPSTSTSVPQIQETMAIPTPPRVKKYYGCVEGKQPDDSSTIPEFCKSKSSWHRKIRRFYQTFRPELVSQVDQLLVCYVGREAELWTELCDRYIVHEEQDRTIKLGMGDFIFFSILVSRAATLDFVACVGCYLTTLLGLGGTMALVAVYAKALPALPLSIFSAVAIYFGIRLAFIPFLNATTSTSTIY